MSNKIKIVAICAGILLVVCGLCFGAYTYYINNKIFVEKLVWENETKVETLDEKIASLSAEIERMNNEDQRKINTELNNKIDNLKKVSLLNLDGYKKILEIEEVGGKTDVLKKLYAEILNDIVKLNLEAISTDSAKFKVELDKEYSRLRDTKQVIPANIVEKQEAPSSGYSKQKVSVNEQFFVVDIVAADLNSTKVIVDTASEGTCGNDCPVLPLATYVSRSGAYAGINGTYFCPETYPDCASKKNTFDVLVMNKNKTYFNSDNNVYSNVPVAIFSGNSARFIRESSGWGRDTGVDSVIANRPLLVLDGNVTVSTTDQNKENLRGNRGFLGASGNTAYIGIVRSATVGEAALVLQKMGVKSSINLDSGGSTALWSGGYKAGPGRNIPNAVLFVKK